MYHNKYLFLYKCPYSYVKKTITIKDIKKERGGHYHMKRIINFTCIFLSLMLLTKQLNCTFQKTHTSIIDNSIMLVDDVLNDTSYDLT